MSCEESITFYDVPLVCGAAPEIGCGSRAKPLLLDLERQAAVKEAWLNRTGTIIAIVWRDDTCPEIAKAVFEKHEVQYIERDAGDSDSEPFHANRAWLRGPEVDRLSREEAGEIAETSVNSAMKNQLVSVEEAAKIKSDIEAYFREELVNFRTKQELFEDVQDKFRQAVLKIYEKHLGTERMAQLRAHGIQDAFNRTGRHETSSCCP